MHCRHANTSLPFLDGSRVAVVGRGYGGFLATKLLAHSHSPVVCGVALAPVAVWQRQDTDCSLAWLGRPDPHLNWEGYSQADLTRQAAGLDNIRDNSFMVSLGSYLLNPLCFDKVVHGTEDATVKVSQSWLLSTALVRAGVLFRQLDWSGLVRTGLCRQMIYPGEDHSLAGVQQHLHRTLEQFLQHHLGNTRQQTKTTKILNAKLIVWFCVQPALPAGHRLHAV